MRAMVFALVAACGGGSSGDASFGPTIDADPAIDAPPPREVFRSTEPLAPGEVIEAKLIGGGAASGDRAIIHLTAPTPTLGWNIHAHPDGTTVTVHEERDRMTVVYDFIPAENTDWFLLLQNGGGVNMDVVVEIELHGALTFGFL